MSISAEQFPTEAITREAARIFLCGDVMTGRGIDQILPHPCDPLIHENYVKSARDYVRLAEQVNGRIPRAVKFSYIWGAALQELARVQPDARIINLETSWISCCRLSVSLAAPAGRFNFGEKLLYWLSIAGGIAVSLSGFLLLFPFYGTNIAEMSTRARPRPASLINEIEIGRMS
jgi:hypothetical protein